MEGTDLSREYSPIKGSPLLTGKRQSHEVSDVQLWPVTLCMLYMHTLDKYIYKL